MQTNVIIIIIIAFLTLSAMFGDTNTSFFPGITKMNIIIYGIFGIIFCYGYGYIPKTEQGSKYKIYFFIGFLSILIAILIYAYIPPILNETEKEYMVHFNDGYSLYQDSRYEEALEELRKAENIYKEDSELYIYKAYCYKQLKQYDKASENAKEALKYPDSKSIYKKANNFKLINLNNDISAYNVIGKAAIKTENYEEAKSAYTYIIEHTTYKYTDAFLYRGICEYYLNQKQAALEDFEKQTKIIDDYLYEQSTTEYPAQYPQFTEKDRENVMGWIRATARL